MYEIAEKFNEYFSKVDLKIQHDIPDYLRDPLNNMNPEISSSMYIFPVTYLRWL